MAKAKEIREISLEPIGEGQRRPLVAVGTRAETTLEESLSIPEVSVVLPVWNEIESLKRLDEELRQVLVETGRRCEILYVDDNSTDGSTEVLRELARASEGGPIRIRIVILRRNYGQTAALSAGIGLAEGEFIVALDADGQNNPADIPRLLEELEDGYDVVSGWRRRRHDRLISRRIPSVAANWLIGKVTGLPLHDSGCTLKAYRASCLREVRLYGDMHRLLAAFLKQVGARVTELEVDHRPRFGGKSKYGPGRVLKVLVDLLHIGFLSHFYTRPMHFFGGLATAFLGLTVLANLAMFAFKFGWLEVFGFDYRASFIETPLPSLAATFFVATVLSLFFGLLAEILIRIHHESSGFHPYKIRHIEDSRGESP